MGVHHISGTDAARVTAQAFLKVCACLLQLLPCARFACLSCFHAGNCFHAGISSDPLIQFLR